MAYPTTFLDQASRITARKTKRVVSRMYVRSATQIWSGPVAASCGIRFG
jgi:hypothetical protein